MKFNKLGLIGALCAAGLLGNTPALAADTTTVTVSATVVGTCKFTSGGSISFSLDPSSTGAASGTGSNPAFWCTKGASYTVSDNKGVNGGGTAYKMVGPAPTDLIPYTFSYTTTGTGTGKATPITLTLSGATVANADFVNASAGNYADTVTLSIVP